MSNEQTQSINLITLSNDGRVDETTQTSCKAHDLPLVSLPRLENDFDTIQAVKNHLISISEQLILFSFHSSTLINTDLKQLGMQFSEMDIRLLCPAQRFFELNDESLFYYYWKYYPRKNTASPNYLNPGLVLGMARDLIQLIDLITYTYAKPSTESFDWQDSLHRYYVDSYYLPTALSISIDQEQQFFYSTSGQASVINWPSISWIQQSLFYWNERKLLLKKSLLSKKRRLSGLKYDRQSMQYRFRKSDQAPTIIQFEPGEAPDNFVKPSLDLPSLLFSLLAWLKAFLQAIVIYVVNLGVTSPARIFRFESNKNPDYVNAAQRFINHLKSNTAFAFAHFNDGELTFIKKFQTHQTKKTWYGRGQQSYDELLGKRLTESIQEQQNNYYRGIPCSICWPAHRSVANELTNGQDFVIPAMTLHHNLNYLPAIIQELGKRELFFISNSKQQFDLLERLGLTIKAENRINVPFVNSYERYDELINLSYPAGSVVILTCGMLAKILIPRLFEKNPQTTFIAFGSSMDDLIQPDKKRFILFPRSRPYTANIYPTKFFLFGRKKPCQECYRV